MSNPSHGQGYSYADRGERLGRRGKFGETKQFNHSLSKYMPNAVPPKVRKVPKPISLPPSTKPIYIAIGPQVVYLCQFISHSISISHT